MNDDDRPRTSVAIAAATAGFTITAAVIGLLHWIMLGEVPR